MKEEHAKQITKLTTEKKIVEDKVKEKEEKNKELKTVVSDA